MENVSTDHAPSGCNFYHSACCFCSTCCGSPSLLCGCLCCLVPIISCARTKHSINEGPHGGYLLRDKDGVTNMVFFHKNGNEIDFGPKGYRYGPFDCCTWKSPFKRCCSTSGTPQKTIPVTNGWLQYIFHLWRMKSRSVGVVAGVIGRLLYIQSFIYNCIFILYFLVLSV